MIRGDVGLPSLALLATLAFAWPSPGMAQQGGAAPAPVESLVLSPEPGERVLQDGVLVAISFVDRDARLDPGSIRITVDGMDVTPEAEISAEVATWLPRTPIAPGPHRAAVTGRTRDGEAIAPLAWGFTVAPGFERAGAPTGPASTGYARAQGSITLEGQATSFSGAGADARREEGTVPRMWVNLGGILGGGFRYSANVHLSGYESADRQPVNRFRIDVRSDHLSVAVGDVNPALQDLILGGIRVRGVQGTVKGAGLGLTVVGGQSRRAIAGLADPAQTVVLRPGTFGQDLLAIRPTFGGDRLLVGLTALRVKDDLGSIPDLRLAGTTASQRVNPSPKENLVGGLDAALRLFSGRVAIQYQSAFSLLANDISGGPLSQAQLDSIADAAGIDRLGVDPTDYEKYFTINASMIPIDPTGLSSLAQQASASVRVGSNMLAAEWRSIGGSYYSLGLPSLVRDRKGIRIRDTFSLLRDALNVSAGLETDDDNLDGIKPATTTRTNLFANVSWQRSPRAATVVASVRQGTRRNDLASSASGALDEESRAVSLGLGLPVGRALGYATRLNLNVSAVSREDPSNPAVDSEDRYYLAGLVGENDARTRQASLTYGLNTSTLTSTADAKASFHRWVGDVRWLVAPRWTATFDGTYTAARSPQVPSGIGFEYDRSELLVGGEFEWTAASFIAVTTGITTYSNARLPSEDSHQVVARVRVHRAF